MPRRIHRPPEAGPVQSSVPGTPLRAEVLAGLNVVHVQLQAPHWQLMWQPCSGLEPARFRLQQEQSAQPEAPRSSRHGRRLQEPRKYFSDT